MSESEVQNKMTDQEYYSQMFLKGAVLAAAMIGVYYGFFKFVLKVI